MSWYTYTSLAISAIAVTGNGFLTWLITTRSALHNTSNWFIVSVSVSDLLVGLFIAPVSAACYKLNTCDNHLESVFGELFLYESIFNLCAMTLDRYLAIVHPLKYPRYMTAAVAVRTISISWGIPLVNFGLHFVWLYAGASTREKWLRIFTIAEAIFMVAIPSLLLLVANVQIVRVARLQAKKIVTQLRVQEINFDKVEGASASPNVPSENLDMVALNHQSDKEQASIVFQGEPLNKSSSLETKSNSRKRLQRGQFQKSSAKVIIAAVTIFLICWSLSLYASFCRYLRLCNVSSAAGRLSMLLIILNSAINPVVFILFKNDIRAETMAISVCRLGQRRSTNVSLR